MIRKLLLVFTIIGGIGIGQAVAQAHPDWWARGQAAFEEGRFEDALAAYEWIIRKEPENPEARYQLARVYFQQGNLREADKTIVRALRLDPQHVSYLELQLQIGFPREPLEIIRNTRKNELAAKILLLDSLSVPPNVQLGESLTRDWLRGRGRVSVKGISRLPDADARPPSLGSFASWESLDQFQVDQAFTRHELPDEVFDLEEQRFYGGKLVDMSEYGAAAYPKAVQHFERALIRDPQNMRAYLSLGRLYLTKPDMPALKALSVRMLERLPDHYYPALFAGYAAHERADVEAAEQHFARANTLMPESIRSIYEDVERLLNKEGRKQKEKQSNFDEEVFWDYRDPRLLTEQNERLTEHYTRVFYADLLFSEPKLDLAGWDSDRGQIMLRYGRPQVEYYMSNSVASCQNTTYENFHVFEYPTGKFVFGTLWPHLNEYVFYSPCSQAYLSMAVIGKKIDYEIIARENIREIPDAFFYDAAGSRVEFPYLANRFKGEAGRTDMVVSYGIPVEFNALQLHQTLNLTSGAFLLSDKEGLSAQTRKSVENIRASEILPFSGGAIWSDVHAFDDQPGVYDLSVEFETATQSGVGFYRVPIVLPDYHATELQVSDLLLAYGVEEASTDEPAEHGIVRRNELDIQPAPWGVFKSGQPLYLYFETYNLQPNAGNEYRYEVEAVLVERRDEKGLAKLLKRAFRGRAEEGVSVSFENTSTKADDAQYLIMDTAEQPAGNYVVVMRVKDTRSGKVVETRRNVLIE